ncbi:MAG: hypothetical protein K0Q68_1506 [Moraxellaceae bacterium]|jgi:uncharacterized repeat protein (TIGR01451 family)|nr:hypothetical protein [Moraxellaceae bacterium]
MCARKLAALAVLLLPFVSPAVQAKPLLKMTVVAEKEVTVTEGGKQVVKRIKTDKSAPGETLIFTLNYQNSGDEKAVDVKLDNPLPTGTKYVAGSATGANSQISYSTDGGKTFAAPEQLSVEKVKAGKKEKARAQAVDYTTIRWVINEIQPGQGGHVSFRAMVQ